MTKEEGEPALLPEDLAKVIESRRFQMILEVRAQAALENAIQGRMKSIRLLSMVVSGALSVIVTIVGVLGYAEMLRWKEIRARAEQTVASSELTLKAVGETARQVGVSANDVAQKAQDAVHSEGEIKKHATSARRHASTAAAAKKQIDAVKTDAERARQKADEAGLDAAKARKDAEDARVAAEVLRKADTQLQTITNIHEELIKSRSITVVQLRRKQPETIELPDPTSSSTAPRTWQLTFNAIHIDKDWVEISIVPTQNNASFPAQSLRFKVVERPRRAQRIDNAPFCVRLDFRYRVPILYDFASFTVSPFELDACSSTSETVATN